MRYLFVIIMVVFISAAASAQVDTLQLVEIGSIQAPLEITELYVEDLNGDSLKEIIICTDYHIYIYNSQTYQVEWTSPPLNSPTDLLFEDINGDGLIDLSVKDNTNIHLFDPHTPQAIWTSPPLDSTYRCYTIGNRNDDDWIDVAIVTKEWFSRINDDDNMDTSWVIIYNGPFFSAQDTAILLYPNYENTYYPQYQYKEAPFAIIMADLGELSHLESCFVIYSSVYQRIYVGLHWRLDYSGFVRIIESVTLDTSVISSIGTMRYNSIENIDNENLLVAIADSEVVWALGEYFGTDIFIIGKDSVISEFNMASSPGEWLDELNGYVLDNFISLDPVSEISYAISESLCLSSLDGGQQYWSNSELNDLASVINSYENDSLYASKKIICGFGDIIYEYRLYDGETGLLTAVISQFIEDISHVSDLNDDRRDEILSLQDNSLLIYDLDLITGVKNEFTIPHCAFLRPNYPNPFNSSTTIEYGLPEAGCVRLDIYDLLGRKVETLVDEEKQAGRHKAVWDASEYSSGVYFYRIEARDFVDTKRMVYLK
ncbi:MAG: T9SS type A sorting domain-containing protein [Candidatus Zixiibacteriota bacterium]|nr:MAG: T9SS type A sorting domain-containing protein [candidate division Zixibacteria bacterium]